MISPDVTDGLLAGKRIGLVLTGGGGKGAYEVGVWRGLVKEGVTRFAAIAGTSIGGLNGYLVARGEVADAEKLWHRLGERSPLKLSLIRLVFGVLERIGISIVLASTTWMVVPFASAAGIAPIVVLLFGITSISSLLPARALLPMLAVLCILVADRALRKTRLGRRREKTYFYSLREHRLFLLFGEFEPWMHHLFALGLVAGLPLWMLWRDVALQHRSPDWWWLLPVPYLIGLATIPLSSDLGVSSISQVPLFAGEDLQRELEPLLQADSQVDEYGVPRLKIDPQLFVTRLVERPINLPDERSTTALGLEYVALRGAPVTLAREVLSATGAIAGFLPRVYDTRSFTSFTVSGLPHIYSDAGAIDNTPIAALLEDDLCDVIVVVLLDHTTHDPEHYLRKHIDSVNERVRQANPDIPDEVWDGLRIRLIRPVRVYSDKLRDVQLVPVVPSKSLGGFFRGTLRFDLRRIQQHIELGAEDAHAAVKRFLGS